MNREFFFYIWSDFQYINTLNEWKSSSEEAIQPPMQKELIICWMFLIYVFSKNADTKHGCVVPCRAAVQFQWVFLAPVQRTRECREIHILTQNLLNMKYLFKIWIRKQLSLDSKNVGYFPLLKYKRVQRRHFEFSVFFLH